MANSKKFILKKALKGVKPSMKEEKSESSAERKAEIKKGEEPMKKFKNLIKKQYGKRPF